MMKMNRIIRHGVRRLCLVLGAVAVASVFSPAQAGGQVNRAADETTTTTRPAATRPAVDADGKLRLTVNESVVVTTTMPVKQLSVGNPGVADVNPVGPNEVLVTAKQQGSTQLIIWDDDNRSQVTDIIVGTDLKTLQGELSAAFPNTKITVQSMNGAIGLRGQVPDIQTAEQAMTSPARTGGR